MLRVTATIVTLLCFEQPLAAEIVRIEVQRQEDVLAGLEFGLAGSYEKLIGLVYFAVDPSNPANQIITDIDNAPRNSEGRVEFHSEFYLLKPKNMGRASGALLFEVGNRGNKGLLSFFNRTGGNHNPVSKANFAFFYTKASLCYGLVGNGTHRTWKDACECTSLTPARTENPSEVSSEVTLSRSSMRQIIPLLIEATLPIQSPIQRRLAPR